MCSTANWKRWVAGFIFLHCPVGGIRHPKAQSRDFSSAALLLHMQPQECLYVGDSYTNDVIGAKMPACMFAGLIAIHNKYRMKK